MSERSLLRIEGLTKRFGGILATDNVSLDVYPGEIHALIGPNGAGKSTLIAQIAGEMTPNAGRIEFDGRDVTSEGTEGRVEVGLSRSFQITSVLPGLSVEDNVALAVQGITGHAFSLFRDARLVAAIRRPAREVLQMVGIADRANVPAEKLNYGQQRLLELAMAIAARPKLVLLDEPMAGLGPVESARIVELLQSLKASFAMLLVEHDMDAVFTLADRISVLVYGRIIATGSAAQIRADPLVREAYLGAEAMDGVLA
jgi:branched-chain amino acid transport system ATP-binding protein